MKILPLSPKSNQVNRVGKGLGAFLGRKNYNITSVIPGYINRGRLCRKREVMGQRFGTAQAAISSRFSLYLLLLEKTEAEWNKSGAGAAT